MGGAHAAADLRHRDPGGSGAGCGQGGETSDAVYVPPPNAKLPTTAAPSATTAAPATGGAAPSSTTAASSTAPTAAVKAEGWGTLKGRVPLRYGPFAGVIRTNEQYGIAFPKGSALVGPVNAALRELLADGLMPTLQRRWLTVNLQALKVLG